MWKDLLGFITQILTLGKELEQNRADIKEMRRDLLNLTIVVSRLSDDIKSGEAAHRHENEKVLLRVQNELLKFEKLLPPAKTIKKK